MTKRIIISLAMIALTIAGVTSATVAYFSKTAVSRGNTFSMGTVSVTQWGGLPYQFTKMIPGQPKESGVIAVKNTGSMPIDLYIGEKDTSNSTNFVGQVSYAIDEVSCDGNATRQKTWVNWRDIGYLFDQWNQVGVNIPADATKCYKVYVKPNIGINDTFQGKYATTDVFIHAVQSGQLAPNSAPKDYTPIP